MRVHARVGLIALAALATGGWVCTSDPCPNQLTCDTDVATFCCPPGAPFACNGTCTSSAASCANPVACRYPNQNDEEPCSIASLSSTIEEASCSQIATGPNDEPVYTVMGSGTMTGCGSGSLSVGLGTEQYLDYRIDCGTWMETPQRACMPSALDNSSTTTWSVSLAFALPIGAPARATVVVRLAALHQPVIAEQTIRCD